MFKNVFGKKKTTTASTVSSSSKLQPTDPQKTIVQLREAISNQEKREEHIEKKIQTMVKEAKAKMSKGDKKGALFAMKRKKLYEQEQEKIQNVKFTLETQVMNLESASQNAQTFNALKQGSNTMEKMRTEVGIEQVDDVMDKIKEEMEMANEVNEAISQPVDPYLVDDDELLDELNALEAADLEAELLAPPPSAEKPLDLPEVPSTKLPALAQKEQDDLKALEAELADVNDELEVPEFEADLGEEWDPSNLTQQELFKQLQDEFDYEGRIPSYIPGFRAGFVGILGAPNMGKSTLLNALLQENLCIATRRPQTTRHAIMGILTTNKTQLCLIDTPGVLENPAYKLQEGMMEAVKGALHQSDLLLVVSDVFSTPFPHDRIFQQLQRSALPVIVAINKVDMEGKVQPIRNRRRKRYEIPDDNPQRGITYTVAEAVAKWRMLLPNATAIVPVSASEGSKNLGLKLLKKILLGEKGIPAATRALGRPLQGMFRPGVKFLSDNDAKTLLPESPPMYGITDLSDRNLRFFASEFIREALFETLDKELPYCCEVVIDDYQDPKEGSSFPFVHINATVVVERSSQKQIVIGKKASRIYEICHIAQKRIEEFLQEKAHLHLEVKVHKDWRRNERKLREFGYF
eukprot:Nitzschia sp. Nitz4//scaffold198_size39746//30491//33100//NITZ4_007606-RA/size39746-augustus-gene-0.9-mRNA-1//-1//CDS//3329540533//8101//frame0